MITKAGYVHPVQNTSIDKKTGNSNHCIHPDFIQNEITESLKRLQKDKIDIFMINNPEKMLLDTNKVRYRKGPIIK
jgi:aryl-alcohol dehydrogenase-like predicted oxidoreductase